MGDSLRDNHPAVSRIRGIGFPSYPQAAGWVHKFLKKITLII